MEFFDQSGISRSEQANHGATLRAFEAARNRHLLGRFDKELLKPCERRSLLAVNSYSRTLWGKAICREISGYLCGEDGISQRVPIYWVTLLDFNCATSISGVSVNIEQVRRRLRSGLRGISNLGIVEPAFYTNLGVSTRFQGKRCLFWHLHALVWGISKRKLHKHLAKLESSGRYLALAETFRGTHAKRIKKGDLPKVAGYMLKSPSNAYRVSRVDLLTRDGGPLFDVNGEVKARFFHRKSLLRKGERVHLFLAMKHLRLDQMAVAGGEGSAMLARAKRFVVST